MSSDAIAVAPSAPSGDGQPAPAGTFPVLPLKNTVLFPSLFLPLAVGRPNSVAAVDAALASEEKTLVLVAQRTDDDEPHGASDPTEPTSCVET